MKTASILMIFTLVVSAACAEAPSVAPAPEQNSEALGALPEQSELEAALEAFDVPGMAMATLTACEVDGVAVAGVADLDTGAPVSADTAFEAASLSKAVFAYLVMTLVEDGLVDLDRPLAEEFDYPRISDKAAYAQITPRMILAHRTGLPNWVDEATEFQERSATIPFEFVPDTAYGYSGEGIQLLQAYIEFKTGTPLQQLFEERLGTVMPQSRFEQPLPSGLSPSRGYEATSQPETGRDMDNLKQVGMAAGSLVTRAGDFADFLSHVCLQRGLSEESYAEMFRPQSPVPEGESMLPTSWGLGWMTVDLGGARFVGHAGNNDEYRALAGIILETGDGFAIFTNGSNGEALINALTAPPEPE